MAGVADQGAMATMVLDTLADDHGIYLDGAEKREKNDHIALFNLDLDNNLIHILPGGALAQELLTNRWDEKKLALNKREEDRNTPNDTCDAGLYAFRSSNHRRAEERAATPQIGSREWWTAVNRAELEAVKDRARRKANPDASNLDREWWNE